jgi:hypothetical protein
MKAPIKFACLLSGQCCFGGCLDNNAVAVASVVEAAFVVEYEKLVLDTF